MFSIHTIVIDAKQQHCLSCKTLWLCCAKLWKCYCNKCQCQYSVNKQLFSLVCWEYELNALKNQNNVGFKISWPGHSVSFTGLCTESSKFKHDCLLHTVTSKTLLYMMWVHWQYLTGSRFLKGSIAGCWGVFFSSKCSMVLINIRDLYSWYLQSWATQAKII